MNSWILPNIKDELGVIQEEQTLKQREQEEKEFLHNLPLPNYVLIDAALWGDEIHTLFASKATYHSLFRGSTGLELWSVAPYLVDATSDENFIQQIRINSSINKRLTWLYSTLNIDALRKHLRRFLRMKKEDGSYIYFRFYDPHVVDTVFPALSEEQACQFFEGIEFLITEDIELSEKKVFYFKAGKMNFKDLA
ncbi:DUF4123 domain-containing protein [Prevotella sp. 10(H)]|uniref:DUF4123 domain-containing protein n=1 Tax=Prevotella sp. 10(H) TaxID=1158294 RepID=UPI0006920952|nr:DUF4123 domain-containing protein [Prevotella sp. 10(H)]